MSLIATPINRSSAMRVLQALPSTIQSESHPNKLGYHEITLNAGGTPLVITLKFDGTWEASTPFMLPVGDA